MRERDISFKASSSDETRQGSRKKRKRRTAHRPRQQPLGHTHERVGVHKGAHGLDGCSSALHKEGEEAGDGHEAERESEVGVMEERRRVTK